MSLAGAKARYDAIKFNARRQATLALRPILGLDFHLAEWTVGACDALAQWKGNPGTGWDWPEIFRRHNDPDRLDIVVWAGDRLAGLALCLTTAQAIEVRYLEGDPRPDCPLRGRRVLIVLECAQNYAHARGRTELWAQPMNDRLKALYREDYGFSLETPKGRRAYYRKRV
jgi:hypothetical protein